MKSRSVLLGAAIATAVVAIATVGIVYWSPRHPQSLKGLSATLLATPPGITLQIRGTPAKTRAARAEELSQEELVYADATGMTLYTDAEGPASRSPTCEGDCLAPWLPAVAPAQAHSMGDWSVTRRKDGTRQWCYRGAPLYRFKEDSAIGDAKGEEGAWRAAALRPGSGVMLRAGISVREVDNAGGLALVDHSGLTLYEFSGDEAQAVNGRQSDERMRHWIPLRAGAMALAAGHFSVISRGDGIDQWAYLGKPLYAFDGDTKPLDANGIGIDARFRPALVERFFMPSDAAIRPIAPLGDILTTTQGATLYQRDRALTDGEGHNFREDHGSPAVGRALGTTTCDQKCAMTWRPFVAPTDALPSGFWDVVVRPDGTRQWAYKGFALYTYTGDKAGDINGNERYDLVHVRDAPTMPDDGGQGLTASDEREILMIPSPTGTGIGALFWHAVIP
jgi:predicted lipoprotein with Yx(FWY)xxD motif